MSLAGKRIVNTRAAAQAAALDVLLRQQGAEPIAYPCIAIAPVADTAPLDAVLRQPDFDLLVLTSVNTVTILAQRLQALGMTLAGLPTAAVGTATALAAREQLGVTISFYPDDHSADELARALPVTDGQRVLLPQSEIARSDLATALGARGADVTAITAYQTVRGAGGVALAPLLRAGQVAAVTFTSSSTVRFCLERLRDEGEAAATTLLAGVAVACIGAQTSSTARALGLSVAVKAQPHTLAGLVAGLAAYFGDPL